MTSEAFFFLLSVCFLSFLANADCLTRPLIPDSDPSDTQDIQAII